MTARAHWLWLAMLAGAFDLNGDGVMEVLVTSRMYEGVATTVYEVGGREARAVLEAECGA